MLKDIFACMDEYSIDYVVKTDGQQIIAVYPDGSIRPVTGDEYEYAMEIMGRKEGQA